MKVMVWDKIWKIILYIKLRFVGSIEKFSALEQVLGNPQVIWMLTLSLKWILWFEKFFVLEDEYFTNQKYLP